MANYKQLENFNEGDESIKTVLLFFQGRFPRKIIPGKDVTLPSRLWPKAKFFIYLTGKTPKNREYFRKMYEGFEVEFVEEFVECERSYIQYANYNAWGGVIGKTLQDQAKFIEVQPGTVYIFFNDEQIANFQDFAEWVHAKANKPGGDKYNPGLADKVKLKKDWSNVVLLFNENKLQDWGPQKINGDININIQYLNDVILYDINPEIIKKKKDYSAKKGCYIGFFIAPRIKLFNRLWQGVDMDFDFLGAHSNSLSEHIRGDGEFIKNSELFDLLREYDYSIYVGKGKPSMYLGATFYEPILQGIPIFIWLKTDLYQKVFPDLDVYFTTAEQLQELVEKWDLEELFKLQVKHLFDVEITETHTLNSKPKKLF